MSDRWTIPDVATYCGVARSTISAYNAATRRQMLLRHARIVSGCHHGVRPV